MTDVPFASPRHLAAAVLAVVSIALFLPGCSGRTVAPPADQLPPVAVRTQMMTITDIAGTFEAGGVVQARTTATIMARIGAPVREVRVAAGDRVRAGQLLVRLDARELDAQARSAQSTAEAASQNAAAAATEQQAAESALLLARTTQERIAILHGKRSATTQELDDANGMLRAAEARATGAAARAQAAGSAGESARAAGEAAGTTNSFASITAPFDGVVAEKTVEPGNMAAPGMPLLRLEDTRSFRLEVRVDESRIGQIAGGSSVPVSLDLGAGGETRTVNGTVSEIGRTADADAQAFLVKITLPATPGLRSGLFGRARFTGLSRRGLVVPSAALIQHGQVTSVLVVENGVARARMVDVSGSEVLAGLADGDVVIVDAPPGLADGRRVTTGPS